MQYTSFDAHKHYTLASVERPEGGVVRVNELGKNLVSTDSSVSIGDPLKSSSAPLRPAAAL
jgi:hypothetical protein